MPTRLRKFEFTVLTNKSGADTSQVPSSGANVALYKHGATVSTAGPTSIAGGGGTVIAVYDSGRLVTGDTVQKGASASGTATVTVSSRTSVTLVLASGSMSVSQGDRLVVTTARPTIYSESTGTLADGDSPTLSSNSAGLVTGYSSEPFLDAIASDGSPAISALGIYNVLAGYDEPKPWIDVRDYGNDLAAAYAALPSGGGVIHIPGGVTCELSAALTITKPVHIMGDTAGSSKIQSTSSNPTHHLLNIGVGNVTLERLEIDGRGTAAAAYDCVRLYGHSVNNVDVANIKFHDVYIHHAQRNGLRITEIIESLFVRVLIADCWGTGYYLRNTSPNFADSEDGNDPPTGGYALTANTHTTFVDCRAANCKERGFFATDSYGTHLISFRSEAHEGRTYGRAANTALGIEMHYSAHSSADGAHLEGAYTNYNNPTTASNRATNWAYFGVCDAIKVVNCSMLANGGDNVPQLKPTYGVLFETCDGVISGGHRFVTMDSKGSVVAGDCTGVTVFESFNNGEAACVDRIDADAASYVGGRGVRVARFADTTARDAATVGGFADNGTIIYLESTNKFQGYASGAWTDLH